MSHIPEMLDAVYKNALSSQVRSMGHMIGLGWGGESVILVGDVSLICRMTTDVSPDRQCFLNFY